MLVVNFFAGPGCGKSSLAAYVFSKLKAADVNAELVTEFAKDATWEHRTKALANQAYVFGNQWFRMTRCQDLVDAIITDSPLPLAAFYSRSDLLGAEFEAVIHRVFNSYENVNFFLHRVKKYNPVGRNQTEAESDQISKDIHKLLTEWQIPFEEVDGNIAGGDRVVQLVLEKLHGKEGL